MPIGDSASQVSKLVLELGLLDSQLLPISLKALEHSSQFLLEPIKRVLNHLRLQDFGL
jgi:hypothetical protein